MKETEARHEIEKGVEQLFGAASHLNDVELTMVRAIWQSEDDVRRDAIWAKAKAHLLRTDRGQYLENARDQITEWSNAGWGASRSGVTVMGSSGGTGVMANVRRRAMQPLLDAALAVIAADGLDQEERDLLMFPVREVTSHHSGTRV